jgi:hypothetical protein
LDTALDLLKSPRLVRVARPHELALGGPRQPLLVVAEGTGWLRVGDVTRFVRGRLEEILLVPPGELTVRFRSLVGAATARAPAVPEVHPTPGRVRVPEPDAPAPAADEVRLARPSVPAPRARADVPHAVRLAPAPVRAPRAAPPVPTLRTALVRPRVRLPEGGSS